MEGQRSLATNSQASLDRGACLVAGLELNRESEDRPLLHGIEQEAVVAVINPECSPSPNPGSCSAPLPVRRKGRCRSARDGV